MAAITWVNQGGTFQKIKKIFVRNSTFSGSPIPIKKVWVNQSGSWRLVFNSVFAFSIAASGNNINLLSLANTATDVDGNHWDGASDVQVTINSGITIGSLLHSNGSAGSGAAIVTGAFPGTLTIVNRGIVSGAGGIGGFGGGAPGGPGSDGIFVTTANGCTVDNAGGVRIAGGGGGGSSCSGTSGGAGGGGGAGTIIGTGGGTPFGAENATGGSDGTALIGGGPGQNGNGTNGVGVPPTGTSGSGGNLGLPGGDSSDPRSGSTAGGAAGFAVRFNSKPVTLIGTFIGTAG